MKILICFGCIALAYIVAEPIRFISPVLGVGIYISAFAGAILLAIELCRKWTRHKKEKQGEEIIDDADNPENKDGEKLQPLFHGTEEPRSLEDYYKCRFVIDSESGEILAFRSDFQQEVYKKYKEAYRGFNWNRKKHLKSMGVNVTRGETVFRDILGSDGKELKVLLEKLGYTCSFELDERKQGLSGVYYID